MQEIILKSEMGVSRLMDVLVDAREVLRNDALLLLIQLTKGHANLQKIVAFENAFDKLCDIIETVMILNSAHWSPLRLMIPQKDYLLLNISII